MNHEKAAITLGSLFDGSGGFPLAGTICGATLVWASEIEPFPIQVTSKRFPHMKHLGDITKINGAEIESVDIITFGSPCQDLSVAGKQKGLDGERSGLFMEAIRIIKEMRNATNGIYPRFIVWENVPGAFSSNSGEDFRTVLKEICRVADDSVSIPGPDDNKWLTAGSIMGNSFSLCWRVIDAQYWGVPQRRRRIFLVADFGSAGSSKILFEQNSLFRNLAQSRAERQGFAPATETGTPNTDRIFDARGNGGGVIAPTMAGDHFGRSNDYMAVLVENVKPAGFNGFRSITGSIEYQEETAPCITSTMPPNVLCVGFNGKAGGLAGNIGYKEELSPTLKAQQETHVLCYDIGEARLRTPSEYKELSPTISARCGTGGNNVPAICIAGNTIDRQPKNGGNGTGCQEETAYTLNTVDRHAVAFGFQGFGDYMDDAKISSTLKARSVKDNTDLVLGNNKTVRRLTPTECARLQGFPSWWTADIPHSDSAEYKMWGNGIALPCAVFVIRCVVEAIKEAEELECQNK